jgi:dihydrofolate reductase
MWRFYRREEEKRQKLMGGKILVGREMWEYLGGKRNGGQILAGRFGREKLVCIQLVGNQQSLL